MNISPYKNKPSDAHNDTGADQPVVSECGKRIFFVTGELGCGKSTFLAALIQKFNLQPSGFITKKEETAEPALYIHQMINGTTQFRYEADNRAGICCSPKPVGFAPVFDAYGVMCLTQAKKAVRSSLDGDDAACSEATQKNSTVPEPTDPPQPYDISSSSTPPQQHLPVILLDELGVMESDAELFFRTVCTLFSNPQYYIIGAVKPHGTRFLPVLKRMPKAAVFHLTSHNRPQLYAQLEQAQSFAVFLHIVSGGSPNGKK